MTMQVYAWKPTKHAIDNAEERFEVEREQATQWLNQIMQDTFAVEEQDDGKVLFQHRKRDIAVVAAPKAGVIITVMHRSAAKNKLITPYLDPVSDMLENALEGMAEQHKKRMHNKMTAYVVALNAAADAAMSGGKHYGQIMEQAKKLEVEIQGINAEYRMAVAKVQAFINSTREDDEDEEETE